MPDIHERWRTSFIEATTYDWAVEHEHIAGVLGQLLWGTDTAAFYRGIARLSELPAGTRVLDIPCGGGVFGPGQNLAELKISLTNAGLVKVKVSRTGAFAYLSAHRRARSASRERSS